MVASVKSNTEAVHWSSRLKNSGAKPARDAGADDVNKRWATRKAASISAYIYSERQPEGLACVIRDTSSSGAKIQLADKTGAATVDDVPDKFRIIVLRHREYTSVDCQVVRRYGDSIGIRYTSQFQTVIKPQRRLGSGAAKR